MVKRLGTRKPTCASLRWRNQKQAAYDAVMRKLAQLGTVLVLALASEAGAQLAAPLEQPSKLATASHVSFRDPQRHKGNSAQ